MIAKGQYPSAVNSKKVVNTFSLICGSIDFLSMDIFSHLWNADSSI